MTTSLLRKLYTLTAVWVFIAVPALATEPTLDYHIDLGDRPGDLFNVRLVVSDLGPDHAIYQFASTAPGTYQVMDIGRFVRDFRALDADGNEIPTQQISTNQWRITDPTRTREITYTILETWDTPVEEHPIYPMAGTSIEIDHVLFNAHAVIGYLSELQSAPLRLHLSYPEGWEVGTALTRDNSGAFLADDYDHAVDSPILLGELTVASTEVTGVPVEIYTYSKSGGVRSEQLLQAMNDVLVAQGAFLDGLPVDRYVFLYHFENTGPINGAWEHSYSSEYVFPDIQFNGQIGTLLKDVAAHEFLHIVTPLNIHSEIIESFNFVKPVPSAHLWLYEGVTEWAAHASQLRAGLKSPEEYLGVVAQKIQADRGFDAEYSLEQLALTSYTDAGQAQYGNIYQRGALVGGLLDILLLDLSDGERGLQDLLQQLMTYYGKERPFPDCCLHDIVAAMTQPEVFDFLESYVENAEPLPIEEYFAKLGIAFIDGEDGPRFEILDDATERQRLLRDAWKGGRAIS